MMASVNTVMNLKVPQGQEVPLMVEGLPTFQQKDIAPCSCCLLLHFRLS